MGSPTPAIKSHQQQNRSRDAGRADTAYRHSPERQEKKTFRLLGADQRGTLSSAADCRPASIAITWNSASRPRLTEAG